MEELDRYIDKVKQLPPAPQVMPQLLLALNSPDLDASRVVKLISVDPALTANVLRLVNSAMFAGFEPVTDLNQAVLRLGFGEVFRLVAMSVASRSLTPPQPGYGIDRGELWKHSVTCAAACQIVASETEEDVNLAFTAGLLHDIGKIVLSGALEHIYARLIEHASENQCALVESEKQLLGVQHAEVGGRLLSRWNFPPALVHAVWFHHDPAQADAFKRLAAVVYLGDMVAHFMGHGYGHLAFAIRGRAEAFSVLGAEPASLPHWMIRTFEKLKDVEELVTDKGLFP